MKYFNKVTGTMVAAATLCGVSLLAQSVEPKFEVASIKPADPGQQRFGIRMTPGGRFTATGASVKLLMQMAYDAYDFQFIGGPDWINTERYEIEAKPEGAAQLQQGDLQKMIRGLLEDRFQLKLTQSTKEMPIYALVVSKGGPKLKEATGASNQGQIRMSRGRIDLQGGTTTALALQLSRQIGRTVLDRTGLTGNYDLSIQWTPGLEAGGPAPAQNGDGAPPADAGGPSIFTAVQEQLGLKLESTKGPVEVFIVEHVERPAAN